PRSRTSPWTRRDSITRRSHTFLLRGHWRLLAQSLTHSWPGQVCDEAGPASHGPQGRAGEIDRSRTGSSHLARTHNDRLAFELDSGGTVHPLPHLLGTGSPGARAGDFESVKKSMGLRAEAT